MGDCEGERLRRIAGVRSDGKTSVNIIVGAIDACKKARAVGQQRCRKEDVVKRVQWEIFPYNQGEYFTIS